MSSSRIMLTAGLSGGKAGTISGLILGLLFSMFGIVEEANHIDVDLLMSLILFPYFMSIGLLVGLFVGTLVGLIFGVILCIHWPEDMYSIRKVSVVVGGLIAATYPITLIWANLNFGEYVGFLQIIFSLGLIVLGCYAGNIGWKTFVRRIPMDPA